jgi:hypothetical protein
MLVSHSRPLRISQTDTLPNVEAERAFDSRVHAAKDHQYGAERGIQKTLWQSQNRYGSGTYAGEYTASELRTIHRDLLSTRVADGSATYQRFLDFVAGRIHDHVPGMGSRILNVVRASPRVKVFPELTNPSSTDVLTPLAVKFIEQDGAQLPEPHNGILRSALIKALHKPGLHDWLTVALLETYDYLACSKTPWDKLPAERFVRIAEMTCEMIARQGYGYAEHGELGYSHNGAVVSLCDTMIDLACYPQTDTELMTAIKNFTPPTYRDHAFAMRTAADIARAGAMSPEGHVAGFIAALANIPADHNQYDLVLWGMEKHGLTGAEMRDVIVAHASAMMDDPALFSQVVRGLAKEAHGARLGIGLLGAYSNGNATEPEFGRALVGALSEVKHDELADDRIAADYNRAVKQAFAAFNERTKKWKRADVRAQLEPCVRETVYGRYGVASFVDRVIQLPAGQDLTQYPAVIGSATSEGSAIGLVRFYDGVIKNVKVSSFDDVSTLLEAITFIRVAEHSAGGSPKTRGILNEDAMKFFEEHLTGAPLSDVRIMLKWIHDKLEPAQLATFDAYQKRILSKVA